MKFAVLDQQGENLSEITLNEKVFAQSFNEDLVHQLVSIYIANSHPKTKGQKNRSSVRGGGRKPWKQKGTGRARAGTSRSPIWRGGGMTFANVFTTKKKKVINKKMYRSAMRSIWSKVLKEERLIALSDVTIDTPPKSSQVNNILKNLGIKSALFVLAQPDNNLSLAVNNLNSAEIEMVQGINPSKLLKAQTVIVTSNTIDSLTKSLN